MTQNKKRWGILSNLYNAYYKKDKPVSIIQFITERCNAKCPHCFIDFAKSSGELSLEDIEKISKTAGNCLRNVTLTGGETFLRNDVFEIANIWYKNSTIKTLSITTNGSMPDRIESFCKQAVSENIPVFFFLSYDFIDEKHSEYRKLKDLHINVIESYKIIKSFNFNATFQLTLSPYNLDSSFQTYIYMRDVLKIQNINCNLFRGEKALAVSKEEKAKIAKVYQEIEHQMNIDFDKKLMIGMKDKSLTSILTNAKNKMVWKYILKTYKNEKFISSCQAGSLLAIISSDGTVAPCELLNYSCGNLKDYKYNFLKCWQDVKAKQIREQITCSKCFCTYECAWLLNIFSHPKYFPELLYNLLRNII